MPKFRKKPVVIEAKQFTQEKKEHVLSWARSSARPSRNDDGDPILIVNTLNGEVPVQIGEWVIKGINGEFYPCDHDVFEATYEPE